MIKISKESKFSKVNITSNINYQGFTLIEILVAIAIMSIVFGFIISSAGALQRKSRDQQRTTDLQNIQSALAQYYADQQNYPVSFTTSIKSSNGNIYLNNVPTDPLGSAYSYTSQSSFSDTTSCDNTTTSCQFYHLCAKLENAPIGSTGCAAGYNFELTPNKSSQ